MQTTLSASSSIVEKSFLRSISSATFGFASLTFIPLKPSQFSFITPWWNSAL